MNYNQFDTETDALFPLILDTMQAIQDRNDNGAWTISMFGSVAKFNELDGYYQEYIAGTKTQAEILVIYEANKDLIKGKWANAEQGTDSKFYYPVYSGSINTYTTTTTPPLPVVEITP